MALTQTMPAISIACKHVKTGNAIPPIKIEYNDALTITMREFCIIINKKLIEIMYKYERPNLPDNNGIYPYEICYMDDGEFDIDKKLPINNNDPFIKVLTNQNKIYDIFSLAFYAHDNKNFDQQISPEQQHVEAQEESTCCVCFESPCTSSNNYFSCGTDLHHICESCYSRVMGSSNPTCPVCRAGPYVIRHPNRPPPNLSEIVDIDMDIVRSARAQAVSREWVS